MITRTLVLTIPVRARNGRKQTMMRDISVTCHSCPYCLDPSALLATSAAATASKRSSLPPPVSRTLIGGRHGNEYHRRSTPYYEVLGRLNHTKVLI
jgi:hypothetical protein